MLDISSKVRETGAISVSGAMFSFFFLFMSDCFVLDFVWDDLSCCDLNGLPSTLN